MFKILINVFKRTQMIKDMQEEIRLEKYNMERQVLLEEQRAAMRTVQLKATYLVLNEYKNAFIRYVAAVETEENVIILLHLLS